MQLLVLIKLDLFICYSHCTVLKSNVLSVDFLMGPESKVKFQGHVNEPELAVRKTS